MDNLSPSQRYYIKHKEARKAYGQAYYKANKEKILENIAKKKKPETPVKVETNEEIIPRLVDASGDFIVLFP